MNLRTFLIPLLLLTLSPFAHAHGPGQPYLERMSNGYLIDIGFDQALAGGDEILIDFSLIENPLSDDWTLTRYSDLSIAVAKDGKQLYAKHVEREDFGKTFITYTFPASGIYQLSVRFEKDGLPLADETFDVTVLPGQNEAALPWTWIVAGGLGIAVIIGGAMVAGVRKNTTNTVRPVSQL